MFEIAHDLILGVGIVVALIYIIVLNMILHPGRRPKCLYHSNETGRWCAHSEISSYDFSCWRCRHYERRDE